MQVGGWCVCVGGVVGVGGWGVNEQGIRSGLRIRVSIHTAEGISGLPSSERWLWLCSGTEQAELYNLH